MKHLQLVLSLLVIAVLLTATGFAGKKGALDEDKALTRAQHLKAIQGYQTLAAPNQPISVNATPISGVKRIGVGKDYPTISSAAVNLAVNGVNGPVTFLLTDASYSETGVLIGSPAGVSAVNTITFQPDSATSGVTVTLTSDPTNGGGWVFSGSQYVTINGTKKNGTPGNRDLTLMFNAAQSLPTSGVNATLRIRDGSHHMTVENTRVFGMYNGGLTAARPAISVTAGAVANHDLTFNNNLMTDCSAGIAIVGGTNFETNITISNNSFGNQFGTTLGGQLDYCLIAGIYTEWTDHVTITGNQVKGLKRITSVATQSGTSDLGRTTGIYELWGHNTVVSYNVIDSITSTTGTAASSARNYGIRIQGLTQNGGSPYPRTNTKIINNQITRVFGVGGISGGDIGIEIFPGHGDSLYHNSISAVGTGSAGRGTTGMQLTGDQAGSTAVSLGWFDVENNAIEITRTHTGGNGPACFRCFSTEGPDISKGDGNVLFSNSLIDVISGASTILDWQAVSGQDAHSSGNDPLFTSDNDLHLTGGLSSALQLGQPLPAVTTDIDGQPRSVTTPDAGVDENGTVASLQDVGPVGLIVPSATGFPQGIPVTTATVRFYNYHLTTASYNVQLVVKDPFGATLGTFPASVSGHAPFSYKDVVFAISFTPDSLGAYPFIMTSLLGSDGNTANDGPLTAPVSAVPLVNGVGYSSGFETPGDNFGWQGDDQWTNTDPGPFKPYDVDQSLLRAGGAAYANVKVGGHITGPHAGSKSWAIISSDPDFGGAGYNDATVSTLYTPFFNFTGYGTQPFMSFYLSMATEPDFDVMAWEYSLDTGKTWHQLGALNDANGINWYNTTTYENADDHQAQFDHAGSQAAGMSPLTAYWTSNGLVGSRIANPPTDFATGPFGYVYNELKLPAAFVGKNYVRFRAQIYGDGNSYDDGWSIDDFAIQSSGAASTAAISGTVFTDNNGNGTQNGGDAPIVGAKIMLSGSKVDSATTNGSGVYLFSNLPPGIYVLTQKAPPASSTTSVPVGGSYNLSVAPAQVITGQNFGNFVSNISGQKFEDVNSNGAKDGGEPGLGSWTIELRKASDSSIVKTTTTAAVTGNYAFQPLPGDYLVKEDTLPEWRQDLPPGHAWYTALHVDTVSGATNITGKDFGNFHKGVTAIYLGVDLNGNGVYDGAPDNFALGAGVRDSFEVKIDGVHSSFNALGNTLDFFSLHNLDTGHLYTVTRIGSAPAGWVRTLTPTVSFTVTASGLNTATHFLDYKAPRVTGIKYNDLNGNGVQDGGEPVLAGWKINLSGTGGGSATTDSTGRYTFLGVGGGAHVLAEVVQGGWVATQPVGGSYALNITSAGLLPGDTIVTRNFGNFQQVTISGQKFRDRNGNAVQDPGDNGLAGWTINASPGGFSALTDASGNYTLGPLGPGTFTVTEVSQLGWTLTTPGGGNYVVVTSSGSNVTGRNFGNYQVGDSAHYRTWTYNELKAASEAKPIKRPKVGKPYPAPNSANLLTDLLTQPKVTLLPFIQVGLSAQTVSGKEKGYLLPGKQAEVYATFNTKSTPHTATARPLSFFNDGIKRILKRQKSLPASKANNILLADLLTFKINLAASAKGQTDPGLGLGNLVLCEAGHPGLSGRTLSDISAYSDSIMTNWDDRGLPGTPSAMWTDLDTVIAKINAAFSNNATGDTVVPDGGWGAPKLKWALSSTTAQSTGFLCAAGPGIESASNPVQHPDIQPQIMPTVYALNQNYPNPFNPTTTLSFDLPENSIVTLKVFNMLGQEVATLYNNVAVDAGVEEVEFDASALTSGVYFYRVTAQAVDDDGMTTGKTFTQTKKMMLVK